MGNIGLHSPTLLKHWLFYDYVSFDWRTGKFPVKRQTRNINDSPLISPSFRRRLRIYSNFGFLKGINLFFGYFLKWLWLSQWTSWLYKLSLSQWTQRLLWVISDCLWFSQSTPRLLQMISECKINFVSKKNLEQKLNYIKSCKFQSKQLWQIDNYS